MKITADTNILVRPIVRDDAAQAAVAERLLSEAETIAIPTLCLAELAWVLNRLYGRSASEIATVIRTLTNGRTVKIDNQAVQAGLVVLDAGGDFADGVIAFEGARLGADFFVSFDGSAVKLLTRAGVAARLADKAVT